MENETLTITVDRNTLDVAIEALIYAARFSYLTQETEAASVLRKLRDSALAQVKSVAA